MTDGQTDVNDISGIIEMLLPLPAARCNIGAGRGYRLAGSATKAMIASMVAFGCSSINQ